MAQNVLTVFQGTPRVGKGMLLIVFALREGEEVVLFRKLSGGYSLLHLDPSRNRYVRKQPAKFADLGALSRPTTVLCLDGFVRDEIKANLLTLGSFSLLATSAEYELKNSDSPTMCACVVPFWSLSDLRIVGEHEEWASAEVKERYFFSGGNLRDFLAGALACEASIDTAYAKVEQPDRLELLRAPYGVISQAHIDWLRMVTVPPVSTPSSAPYPDASSNLARYALPSRWVCAITSQYMLPKLGEIVTPSFYEGLWSRGRSLHDHGLMGITLENYDVHTMCRDRQQLTLKWRKYNTEVAYDVVYDTAGLCVT